MKHLFTTFASLLFLFLPQQLLAQTEINENGEYVLDFVGWNFPGGTTWYKGSYDKYIVDYDKLIVTFEKAANLSNMVTIPDRPVTKNNDIIITLKDKSDEILSVSATFKQWDNKKQTIIFYTSQNDGSTFTKKTSSTNFSISFTTLPENTNALKFSFTEENQIGVSQICVKLKSMPASRVVTVPDAGYATFCPLYDASIEKEDGAQIYYVSDWSANSLTLKEHVGTTLRKGTGIIIKGAQKRVRFTETVLSAEEESESAGIYTKNKLRGTTVQTRFEDNEVFILAQPAGCSVGFYPNRGGDLAAEKAYISISEWSKDNGTATDYTETAAQRCALTMCHEGGATAVMATTGRVTGRSGMGYNLAGQQVSGSYDGIVVRDGRKIISRRSGRGCSR